MADNIGEYQGRVAAEGKFSSFEETVGSGDSGASSGASSSGGYQGRVAAEGKFSSFEETVGTGDSGASSGGSTGASTGNSGGQSGASAGASTGTSNSGTGDDIPRVDEEFMENWLAETEKYQAENAKAEERGAEAAANLEQACVGLADSLDDLGKDSQTTSDTTLGARLGTGATTVQTGDPAFMVANTTNTDTDTENIEAIRSALSSALQVNDGAIGSKIASIQGLLDGLNKYTKEKLDISAIVGLMQDKLSAWNGEVERLIGEANEYYNKVVAADEGEDDGNTDPTSGDLDSSGGTQDGGGSKNGPGNRTSSGSGGGFVGITDPQPKIEDNYIQSAVAGTLLFTAIVPLFSKIGDPSTIQSSLTTTYEVVGLVYQNGKYYYKLYDPSLKQFYYAEVDKNSKFTTEYKEILKSKEGENTMMLTTPNVGENVFAKMTDPNTPYFIKDKMEQNGINFAMVLDGSDGKYYYVPIDNTVEVVSIDSMVSGVPVSDTSENTGTAS